MAFSIINYTGNGVTVTYALNFALGILAREHVQCRVNNEVDGLDDPLYRDLDWINDGLVTILGTVPANGVPIVFTRTVPKTELIHDYANGAAIEEGNLDESNKQTLMATHEFLDGRFSAAAVNLDMGGFRVTNMAEGTEDDDAVTLSQLEDYTGDAPGYAAIAQEAAEDAEEFFEQFSDIYLGAKASDPTVDNDGDPLTAGALYLNTGSNLIKYYTGSVWLSIGVPVTPGAEDVFYDNGASGLTADDVQEAIDELTGYIAAINTDLVFDADPTLGAPLETDQNQVRLSKGADVASATELAILADGNYYDVTGTTTITSIATSGSIGTVIKLHFDAVLTLTHHATDLVLPGGANITTAAGDEAELVEYAAGDWRCIGYTRANGRAVVSSLQAADITGQSTVTIVGADYLLVSDTSNSGALAKGLASDIVALAAPSTTFGAVGTYTIAGYSGGGGLTSQAATRAGSDLDVYSLDTGGGTSNTGGAHLSGTWRLMCYDIAGSVGDLGLFVRTV